MLNLNITLSNFKAEIIILSLATNAEIKNGVAYKKKKKSVYFLKILLKFYEQVFCRTPTHDYFCVYFISL